MILNPVVEGSSGGGWIPLQKIEPTARIDIGGANYVTQEIPAETCCLVIYSSGSRVASDAYGAITIVNISGTIYAQGNGSTYDLSVKQVTYDSETSTITMNLSDGNLNAPDEAYYKVIKK